MKEKAETTPARYKSKPILVLFLIGIVFAVYANSISGPFLFDDVILVKNNPLIKDISNIPELFKTDIFAHDINRKPTSNSYRPIQMSTYAVDFFLWGDDPKGFHFGNILLHVFNVLLVFLLAGKIFNSLLPPYFLAMFFGIHPVNTACVSYISGRADLLVATFILLSVIFYIDYIRNRRAVFLSLSVLAYLFALYSKEYAILVLPAILFIYNTVFDRRNTFKPKRYVFYILPLILYFTIRAQALKNLAPLHLELSKLGLFPRVLTSLKTLFIDIRILFLPYDLHFGRTTEVEHSIFNSPYSALSVLGLLLGAYILKTTYRRWKKEKNPESGIIFFGISWFFVSMIPLLNIFPLQAFHADNWLYFSSIGVCMAIASLISRFWQLCSKRSAILGNLLFLLACLAFLPYGFATVSRNRDYRDAVNFHLSSVKWRPNVKSYSALARLYGERNDLDNAIKYSEKAIEINKIYPSADVVRVYYNLGITYMNFSRYGEAERMFKKVMTSTNEPLKKEASKYLSYLKQHR